jgi:GT2 family glycosyltransferase
MRGWRRHVRPVTFETMNVGERRPHSDADRRVSVVVLTHNRVELLRQCVENVLLRTSGTTTEIVIWNNASTDGTREYLDHLTDHRIKVIHHPTNIGINAYSRAFKYATGEFLIEVDDDVIDAPRDWDKTLLEAFLRLPDVGYLAANLVHNPHDITSGVMYGINAHLYRIEEINGIRLKVGGPVGGWCTLTSRELYDRVGGWTEQSEAFWLEDGAYVARLGAIGYRAAHVEDLRVLHASGPHYSPTPREKLEYWRDYNRAVARKNAFKRLLLRVPSIRFLNDRHGWFQPPRERPDYVRLYEPVESDDG